MGYTKDDKILIKPYLEEGMSVLDLGSQNDYEHSSDKPPFVSEWYRSMNINYTSIDLAGDNNSIKTDLSFPAKFIEKYDVVVDAGFGEHIVQSKGYENVSFHGGHINSVYPTNVIDVDAGFYNLWLNKHNALKVGGIMININPKTGHWPNHAYTYLTKEFYLNIEKCTAYQIIELFEQPASGNSVDGWNIVSVMRKNSEVFPTEEAFKFFDYYKK